MSARPSSGSFDDIDPTLVYFLPRLVRSDYVDFLFYKVYLNTLDIYLHWILIHVQSGQSLEVSAPLLRVLLILNISDVFGGGSEVFSEYSDRASDVFRKGDPDVSSNFLDVYERYGFVCPFLFTWWVFNLVAGIYSSDRSSDGVLFGGSCLSLSYLWWQGIRTFCWDCFTSSWRILSLPSLSHYGEGLYGLLDLPKRFPIFFGVLWSSQRDCSATASDVPGSLRLFLCIPCLTMKNVLVGCLYYIKQNLRLRRLYSCYMRRIG